MIAAKVANALAPDWPRERLQVIVAVDGGAEPAPTTPSARGPPARTSCWSSRAAARSARRTRPSGGAPAGDRWPSATPTPSGSPARCARSRPPSRTRRSATPAAASRSSTTAGPTRRASTGATRCGCAAASPRWPWSPAATGRSTRSARRLHRGRPGWATTSCSRSTWSSAAGARSTFPPRAATEKMVPSIEGECARKRRMMSHAWPIVLRGGLLDPRGYRRCTR